MYQAPIVFVFIVSGAIALGYQVFWSKFLLDFIGVSAYSYAVVLASFMAGLSIGSRYFGKLADRVPNPLMLYVGQELFLGFYALVYPLLNRWSEEVFAHYATAGAEGGPSDWIFLKLAVSAILLLPPTIAMGGTFPVLMKHVTHSIKDASRHASLLYAANALGSVLGILLVAFYLMPVFGMTASVRALALCNFLIAFIALFIAVQSPAQHLEQTEYSAKSPAITSSRLLTLCYFLIFGEGVVAFVYEISWTRYFALVLGSSTYSFSIMLASFISGITLGSALFLKLESKVENPLMFFGISQLICSALILILLPFYPYLPWLFQKYGSLWSTNSSAFYPYEIGKMMFCYIIMLLPAMVIGMAFPTILKSVANDLDRLGKDTGNLYSWNTLGNVLGAIVGSLVLLPWLGLERLLAAAAVTNIALGWGALAVVISEKSAQRRQLASMGILTIALLLFVLVRPEWNHVWFTLSPLDRSGQSGSLRAVAASLSDVAVPLFKEDPAGNVIVRKDVVPQGEYVSLFLNGKADASTGDMATQVLLGHLPMLFHPEAQDVLTIGLASGITAGAVLTHPVKRADIVEIVRSMPSAAFFFDEINHRPLSDARSRLIIDDARSYLSYTQRTYDVIISAPSNPWMAGLGALFSSDFYKKAPSKLKPGGFYLQWIQLYNMSNRTFAVILRTFHRTFPYVYAFQANAGDLLLLGSRTEIRPDWNKVERVFENPVVREDLRNLGIMNVSQLLYLQRFSPGSIRYLAALTDKENTDDNHYVEYRAPMDLFQSSRVDVAALFDERLSPSSSLFISDYRHQLNPDAIKSTEVLSRPRLALSDILQVYRVASHYATASSGPALFPMGAASLVTPSTEIEISAAISALLSEGRLDAARDLLLKAKPVLLVTASLSREHGSFWLLQLESWRKGYPGNFTDPEFRKFEMELLMAQGESSRAIALLQSWVHSDSPPPMDWALLRGSQWLTKEAMTGLVNVYLHRDQTGFVQRLAESITGS